MEALRSPELLRLSELELIPPQTASNDALHRAREAGVRSGFVDIATGVGKTLAVAHDIKLMHEENPNARTLYLCHRARILQHARQTFEEILAPDVTHGDVFAGESDDQAQVVYATFQTMTGDVSDGKRYESFMPDEFDYVVVDEAHHGPADSYRDVIDYFEPSYFKLGQTATPFRSDEKEMSDIFGPCLSEYHLEDAIADGVLTKPIYKLYTQHERQLTTFLATNKRATLKQINTQLERIHHNDSHKDEIAAEILREQRKHGDPRTIVYCPSIAYAEDFAKRLPMSLPLHSKLSKEDQEGRFQIFKDGYLPTLLVVNQLDEGVDVPEVNMVVFLNGTESKRVFLQQFGRGLRKFPGKDNLIALDFAASWERIKLIADLKADVEALSRQRQTGAKQGKPNAVPRRHEQEPFEFSFSQAALDAIDVIAKARGQSAKLSQPDKKGVRAEKWDEADELAARMLNLPALSNQRLTESEINHYGIKIAAGDKRALQEFTMSRLRYAMLRAQKSLTTQDELSSFTLEDHFQSEIEALQNHCLEYDPNKHGSFDKYLKWVSFVELPANHDEAVASNNIPMGSNVGIAKLLRAQRQHNQLLGYDPSLEDLAILCELDEHMVERLLAYQAMIPRPTDPHQLAAGHIENTASLIDTINDTTINEYMMSIMEKCLSYRERRVLELRFGLGNQDDPKTLDMVGRTFNVTRDRIRQIENQALKVLDEYVRENEIENPCQVLPEQEHLGGRHPDDNDTIRRLITAKNSLMAKLSDRQRQLVAQAIYYNDPTALSAEVPEMDKIYALNSAIKRYQKREASRIKSNEKADQLWQRRKDEVRKSLDTRSQQIKDEFYKRLQAGKYPEIGKRIAARERAERADAKATAVAAEKERKQQAKILEKQQEKERVQAERLRLKQLTRNERAKQKEHLRAQKQIEKLREEQREIDAKRATIAAKIAQIQRDLRY